MSLFRDERYSSKALQISNEIEKTLQPILIKYVKQGYSIRELGHLALLTCFDVELMTILNWSVSQSKETELFSQKLKNDLQTKLLFRTLIGLSIGLVLGLLSYAIY